MILMWKSLIFLCVTFFFHLNFFVHNLVNFRSFIFVQNAFRNEDLVCNILCGYIENHQCCIGLRGSQAMIFSYCPAQKKGILFTLLILTFVLKRKEQEGSQIIHYLVHLVVKDFSFLERF